MNFKEEFGDDDFYDFSSEESSKEKSVNIFGSVNIQNKDNHSIQIGEGNIFNNFQIGSHSSLEGKPISDSKKNTFYNQHPVISGLLISIAAGILASIPFWKKIIEFVERLF